MLPRHVGSGVTQFDIPLLLSGSTATIFVDNDGVLGSLIKGSCKAPEVNIAVDRWWL